MVPCRPSPLAERPDLVDAFWSIEGDWPESMLHDPFDGAREATVAAFPELPLVVLDGGVPVARLHAVPLEAEVDLPSRGWDHALQHAERMAAKGVTPDLRTVSLIEARVAVDRRGGGLSGPLLAEARRRYATLGVRDLVGPVRPTRKSLEPKADANEYARRVRGDGLPADPWLRVHARRGGRIIEGGLAPVHVDVANDHAVYVEPNVWVHHDLRSPAR